MNQIQCRAARALLGWTQGDLSARIGFHKMCVFRYERDGEASSVSKRTVEKMKKTLEDNGVEFIGTTGVNLKIR